MDLPLPSLRLRRWILSALTLALSALLPGPLLAQEGAPGGEEAVPRVADDPEVLAQIRLFTTWMEGQLESRGLPGVAVGVVADKSWCGRGGSGMRMWRKGCP